MDNLETFNSEFKQLLGQMSFLKEDIDHLEEINIDGIALSVMDDFPEDIFSHRTGSIAKLRFIWLRLRAKRALLEKNNDKPNMTKFSQSLTTSKKGTQSHSNISPFVDSSEDDDDDEVLLSVEVPKYASFMHTSLLNKDCWNDTSLRDRFITETIEYLDENDILPFKKGEYKSLAVGLFKAYPRLHDGIFQEQALADESEVVKPRAVLTKVLSSRIRSLRIRNKLTDRNAAERKLFEASVVSLKASRDSTPKTVLNTPKPADSKTFGQASGILTPKNLKRSLNTQISPKTKATDNGSSADDDNDENDDYLQRFASPKISRKDIKPNTALDILSTVAFNVKLEKDSPKSTHKHVSPKAFIYGAEDEENSETEQQEDNLISPPQTCRRSSSRKSSLNTEIKSPPSLTSAQIKQSSTKTKKKLEDAPAENSSSAQEAEKTELESEEAKFQMFVKQQGFERLTNQTLSVLIDINRQLVASSGSRSKSDFTETLRGTFVYRQFIFHLNTRSFFELLPDFSYILKPLNLIKSHSSFFYRNFKLNLYLQIQYDFSLLNDINSLTFMSQIHDFLNKLWSLQKIEYKEPNLAYIDVIEKLEKSVKYKNMLPLVSTQKPAQPLFAPVIIYSANKNTTAVYYNTTLLYGFGEMKLHTVITYVLMIYSVFHLKYPDCYLSILSIFHELAYQKPLQDFKRTKNFESVINNIKKL